jgi:type I restriction enzyme R subunit
MVPPDEPERRARVLIDRLLDEAGWAVQDRAEMNLAARRGVAVREFPMAPGHGNADYLLFVDHTAVGVIEAKPAGHTLSGVQVQARTYSEGLPEELRALVRPLPFIYASTGSETLFLNGLDPVPRSRRVYSFHRPETLADWIGQDTLPKWTAEWMDQNTLQERKLPLDCPSTLRSRLRTLPALNTAGLRPNQIEGIHRLEQSLYDARPRALVQMATGSGKTYFAITSIYRMIKFGGARRVVFIVDRANLAKQAEKEFQGYVCADSNRKFTELYVVQRLTSNKIADSAKVVITTIQRLYSMLQGKELDPQLEERSQIAGEAEVPTEPVHVGYNAAIPPEFFDVMFVDECHC